MTSFELDLAAILFPKLSAGKIQAYGTSVLHDMILREILRLKEISTKTLRSNKALMRQNERLSQQDFLENV